jgi:hypothetical protein
MMREGGPEAVLTYFFGEIFCEIAMPPMVMGFPKRRIDFVYQMLNILDPLKIVASDDVSGISSTHNR